MYLLTFIVLLVSVLGLYANVAALQAGKIAERQTVAGELMRQWSGAAFNLARLPGVTIDIPVGGWAAGCSFTNPADLVVALGSTAPVTCSNGGVALTIGPDQLPGGYNFADYTFSSILYQPTARERYVITYLIPPANLNDPIGQPSLGLPIGEVYRQLTRTNLPLISYGYVANGRMEPRSGRFNYALPSGGVVPDGALAIITTP